jgi:acetolactate synthase-1/3 small subunit
MDRHVLSVLVKNSSGVLTRVAGLFARRGFNIDSLTVGRTENVEISRMTIALMGDEDILEQVIKQLNKLEDVQRVVELYPEQAVYRELVLIKVRATAENRAAINEVVKIFRSKIIDVSVINFDDLSDEDLIKLAEEKLKKAKPFALTGKVKEDFSTLHSLEVPTVQEQQPQQAQQ